jgi:CheY-like chemotaxis protein
VHASSDGPGRGSTFVVELPTGRREASRPAREARAAPPGDTKPPSAAFEPDLAGLRVLYVDDEADARALVRQILEERDAEVLTAATAPEALALLRAQRLDVLVSDIGMPGMDGLELMRELRSLPESQGGATPAAAFTAYVRAEDRAAALSAGYQAYLTKPLDPIELVRAVAALAARVPAAGANPATGVASNRLSPLSDG